LSPCLDILLFTFYDEDIYSWTFQWIYCIELVNACPIATRALIYIVFGEFYFQNLRLREWQGSPNTALTPNLMHVPQVKPTHCKARLLSRANRLPASSACDRKLQTTKMNWNAPQAGWLYERSVDIEWAIGQWYWLNIWWISVWVLICSPTSIVVDVTWMNLTNSCFCLGYLWATKRSDLRL
jgi:hypothetical protein